jgi:hypothetical protein
VKNEKGKPACARSHCFVGFDEVLHVALEIRPFILNGPPDISAPHSSHKKSV